MGYALGYANYGDGLMALNGCGPTALSMVICGLTGDNTITPYTVAQYADSQGLYVDGVGTSWDLMRTGQSTSVSPPRSCPWTRAWSPGL